jgi:hypothetical protein
MSRNKHYLTPIPTTIKAIKKETEIERKFTKNRYNCKNISQIPVSAENRSLYG